MPIPAFVPVLSSVDVDDGDAELVGSVVVVVAGDDDRGCEDLEEGKRFGGKFGLLLV
jgi:hypothetical protein